MKEKSQNKKKSIKAIILRKMLANTSGQSSCEKVKLENLLVGEIFVSRLDARSKLAYHLYSKKKNEEGLITKGLIIRKGKIND